MSWIANRLAESSTRHAVTLFLGSLTTVASNPAAYTAGALSLWLTLVPPLVGAVGLFLYPENPTPAGPE